MRTKDIDIHIKLSSIEYANIKNRMSEMGFKNFSAFIRKMALNGLCINLDLSIIQDLNYQINKIGNNINQVVKHTNEVGTITKDDIKYLKRELNNIYSLVGDISSNLSLYTKI